MSDREVVWCCRQCGKTGKTRFTVGSESCYLNAVQVYADSIQRDKTGHIVQTQAVEYVPPGPSRPR